jgi:hypothetical protein
MNQTLPHWKEAWRLQAWRLQQTGWAQRQMAEALGGSAAAVSQGGHEPARVASRLDAIGPRPAPLAGEPLARLPSGWRPGPETAWPR